jgi:sulfur-carrier protein adenylyltransferase/sulfurtransferase
MVSYQGRFDYDEAYARNIGLVTKAEQQQLRNFRIAVPGLGGVGGSNLICLVRQGFVNFNISDIDVFDVVNTNRQYGSTTLTYGEPKVDVMRERALEINPDLNIQVFPDGIGGKDETYRGKKTYPGIDKFLSGIDLVVDSLDFFAIDARRAMFKTAEKMRIPIISAGPLGFGTAYLIFMPGGPTFDQYMGIDDKTKYYHALMKFAAGTSPKALQAPYMYSPEVLYESLVNKRPPSSGGSVEIALE